MVIIILSKFSPRLAGVIGKKDPVATLATLILLPYSKLLSTIISALAFAVLQYPDGSKQIVWLLDGNIKYFQGNNTSYHGNVHYPDWYSLHNSFVCKAVDCLNSKMEDYTLD